MTESTVIFLGPSLPLPEARSILPDAIYLPPAGRADIASAQQIYAPKVIGLIDGVFNQSLAVGHKEILHALSSGVQVLGAASMGALRAAELASYGMVGVGQIYNLYADGILNDDDEVCLAHAAAEHDYTPLSVPLVNVRATLWQARDSGKVTKGECERLIEIAASLHYVDRTWPAIIHLVQKLDDDDSLVERFAACATTAVDLKAADARLLLETVRSGVRSTTPKGQPFTSSVVFESLWEDDRRVARRGTEVSLRSIVAYAALHETGFDRANFHALNRTLVGVLARILQVAPTPDDVAAETTRFRTSKGLQAEYEFGNWLRGNDMDVSSFEGLMQELAVCRRLQRWLLASDESVHHTRWVLDEFRLADAYPSISRRAAEHEAVLNAGHAELDLVDGALQDLNLDELLAAHEQATGRRFDMSADQWAEEAGFNEVEDLVIELIRAKLARDNPGH